MILTTHLWQPAETGLWEPSWPNGLPVEITSREFRTWPAWGTGSRANANYFLRHGETVLDDEDADLLTGASGRDRFFFDPVEDNVTQQAVDEVFGNDLATLP